MYINIKEEIIKGEKYNGMYFMDFCRYGQAFICRT